MTPNGAADRKSARWQPIQRSNFLAHPQPKRGAAGRRGGAAARRRGGAAAHRWVRWGQGRSWWRVASAQAFRNHWISSSFRIRPRAKPPITT